MSRTAAAWARGRSAVEWVSLLAGLAAFAYLGWDSALWDPRLQLLLHLLAIGGIGGVVVHGWRGGALPRTAIDVPILALLASFALATLLAVNLGMSLRSMASIVALTLMLPVALLAIRARPSWTALVVCLPTLGLASGALGAILARRLAWVLAGAPGLPPLRMPAEGTPFGSVAVAPFVILGAWVVAGRIAERPFRRAVRMCLAAVGVPLAVLSGSRSAWLAIAVSGAALVVPWAWARRNSLRRPERLGRRGVAVAGVAVFLLAGLAIVVGPRLTASSSLIYRGELWRDTVTAWLTSPLTGLGPGIMPYARQAAAPDGSFPVSQPHSHDWALGLLGDAGILGLAAGIVLAAAFAWSAGPWRSRTREGRIASSVLIGIAVSAIFEDITFLPNFCLVVLLVVAIALEDAGAVRWQPWPRPSIPVAALAGGASVTLLLAMVVADAGAIAYREGIEAGRWRDWAAAAGWFERSVAVDPWHPLGPGALGVALAASGEDAAAREELARAARLNPGDGRTWANLAVVCRRLGDAECERDAARRAIATARLDDQTLVIAALSLDRLGETQEADAAYRRSLLTHPMTAFEVAWPRAVIVGDGRIDPGGAVANDLSLFLARHATGDDVSPDAYATAAVRALGHAVRGDEAAARDALEAARRASPGVTLTWEIDLVLRRAWGEALDPADRIYAILTNRPIRAPDAPFETLGAKFELGSFRLVPRDGFVPGALEVGEIRAWPWILGSLLPSG
jgi:tetratricopeptide (TPR) repeat protein